MSNQPIRVKIDVTKIDKSALFKGAKGTYLDVTLWPTPDSQYGDDYRATQDIGKERREKGEKGPIIGNAKLMEGAYHGRQQPAKPLPTRPAPVAAERQAMQTSDDGEGYIPF